MRSSYKYMGLQISIMPKVIDSCVHQWTMDAEKMVDKVSEKWQTRLEKKSKIQDPVSGTLMPTIPWHHDYWNADAPDTDIDPERFRDPEKLEADLDDKDVDQALLTGHTVKFLPSIPNPNYAANLASAYNELLDDEWLSTSEKFVGGIVVSLRNPDTAVDEIQKHADNEDFVSVLIYSGNELPLGHESYHKIYEAAADNDLPVSIHTSGNPVHRQTAMGIPQHYATHDTNLTQNHMVNVDSMIFRGVFDKHPDLDVVWMGEGIGWLQSVLWRCTRFYRNLHEVSPDIEKEPIEYINQLYVTTYPLGGIEETNEKMYGLLGEDRIVYGSGYPHWNADTLADLPDGFGTERDEITHGNAQSVYGI